MARPVHSPSLNCRSLRGWSRASGLPADARPSPLPNLVRSGLIVWVLVLGTSLPPAAHARGDAGADGRFDRRDSFHFTLFQDVDLDEYGGFNGSRRFEQEVLKELEAAYDRMGKILGLRPERKLQVHVWDPTIFENRFAGLFRFPAAGFYGGSIHIRGNTRVTTDLVRVLHHELVHAAFDAVAPRLTLPAWFNEGVAEWFEARAIGKRGLSSGEANALRRAAAGGELFRLSELSAPSLGGLGPRAASLAYLESYAFITYIVDAHGDRGLLRFWSELERSRNFDRASRRAFRTDLEDLEGGFRRSWGAR